MVLVLERADRIAIIWLILSELVITDVHASAMQQVTHMEVLASLTLSVQSFWVKSMYFRYESAISHFANALEGG